MKIWEFPINISGSRTVIFATVLSLLIIFNMYELDTDLTSDGKFDGKIVDSFTMHNFFVDNFTMHNFTVEQYYQRRNTWVLSKLGNVVFKNEGYPVEKRNKTFVVLIWKHWKFLQQRYLYNYGKVPLDPLEECSVKNCRFTGDDDKLESADAVIAHLFHGGIPPSDHRNPNQRWIFQSDESPLHTFTLSPRRIRLPSLHNVFNWSMNYKSDSDVPVPYGRTVGLKTPKLTSLDQLPDLIPNWKSKKRDVLVGILISNCRIPYRLSIIKGLKECIKVDAHGKCGDVGLNKSCPGHFRANCDVVSPYLFYLALENSKCSQYMTEKLFHNAYSSGAIPIIQGSSVEDCQNFLPPNSYLHVDNYANLKDLAEDILRISKNETELLLFHKWRNHFEVTNEHGFVGTKSYHLCRVCEALNYNDDAVSVYSERRIFDFLDPSKLCRK